MKTMTVYLAGYNQGEYDDYSEVWLRVFACKEHAEQFNAAHAAARARRQEILQNAEAMYNEVFTEEAPRVEQFGVSPKVPQWNGKKGSKKEARKHNLPEVQAFDRSVAEAQARINEIMAQVGEARKAYYERGLLVYRECLVKCGMAAEKAAFVVSTYGPYFHERSYEVKELPFFGNPEDFINALTESLESEADE